MNDAIDIIVSIFAVSGCFWILYVLYVSLRVDRFIVKRYEQQTDLLETAYFKEHATFTKYLPGFLSSAIYSAHLLSILWGWNFSKSRKAYRDIEKAEHVIDRFSQKEIRLVKRFGISGLILIIHFVFYYLFKWIWPEMFS